MKRCLSPFSGGSLVYCFHTSPCPMDEKAAATDPGSKSVIDGDRTTTSRQLRSAIDLSNMPSLPPKTESDPGATQTDRYQTFGSHVAKEGWAHNSPLSFRPSFLGGH